MLGFDRIQTHLLLDSYGGHLAAGNDMLGYLRASAEKYRIGKHFRFNQRVVLRIGSLAQSSGNSMSTMGMVISKRSSAASLSSWERLLRLRAATAGTDCGVGELSWHRHPPAVLAGAFRLRQSENCDNWDDPRLGQSSFYCRLCECIVDFGCQCCCCCPHSCDSPAEEARSTIGRAVY